MFLLYCLQVRVLSGQLRDAQNLLITKDRAAAVAAAAAGLKGGAAIAAGLGDPAAAVAAQRKAAELTRELCRCGFLLLIACAVYTLWLHHCCGRTIVTKLQLRVMLLVTFPVPS
jgi:hypothetical protein